MADLINRKQAIELIRSFIDRELDEEEWYQNIKEHFLAVVLYGSVAKGINRVDSDIDILLIMPLEIEEKYTVGEYVYNYEGREMNIVIRSIEKLRMIASEGNDTFQKEIFRDAEIIWSRDNEVANLLRKIR